MKTRFHETLNLRIDQVQLSGEMILPEKASSLVLFSHGSGSSRFSPRNNFVAKELHNVQIGSFLFDLLTEEEDEMYSNRFNIEMLTSRLVQVTEMIAADTRFSDLKMGYFGASTGAASALKAAAKLPDLIHAVVSRGGRPDLATPEISEVKAPTLLIVGGLDLEVIQLNKTAYEFMTCTKKLKIVEGATHLFEEPGTLEQVATYAAVWFKTYLV
ncbi:dienelactone hydrolase family protein [Rhodonellum sp.]|uniref:dienelactone hydrolase family protein n=1 Tax=Rhodonellum sp. TaxID=2231180 RepID=UPI00272132F3|nr:dienelactone hydrolase family protein [Rhodonellum sp.]MDO9554486.1 dienelactone hydrolase family protein [Rhodonellum sp.]